MKEHDLLDSRILIVDDQASNIALLKAILETAGYRRIIEVQDPFQFEPIFIEEPTDLVLLDLHMPGLDGHQILANMIHLVRENDFVPVIVLTADVTMKAREAALKLGARDFLTKPFDNSEVLLRIGNHLETRHLHRRLARHAEGLERAVAARTVELVRKGDELEQARLETLRRLAKAAEFRDDETGRHTIRVGHNAALLAEAMDLGLPFVNRLREAAPLHDLGKIGIPDSILLKPGKLDAEEWSIMKTHTTLGGQILRGCTADVLHLAEEIALTHHEKWDGSGYNGVSGENIPLSGRIVAIADVFDALTHPRPYKAAWPRAKAIEEILRCSGTHFDPEVVKAFDAIKEQFAVDVD